MKIREISGSLQSKNSCVICGASQATGLVLLQTEFIYFIYLICLFKYLFIENNDFVSGLYQLCCYSNCVWCDKAHVVSVRGKIGGGELMHEGSTPTFAYCKRLRMQVSSRYCLAEKERKRSCCCHRKTSSMTHAVFGFHNRDGWY